MKLITLKTYEKETGKEKIFDFDSRVTIFPSSHYLDLITLHLSTYLNVLTGSGRINKSKREDSDSILTARIRDEDEPFHTTYLQKHWETKELHQAFSSWVPFIGDSHPLDFFAVYKKNRATINESLPSLSLWSGSSDALSNALHAGLSIQALSGWWEEEEEQEEKRRTLKQYEETHQEEIQLNNTIRAQIKKEKAPLTMPFSSHDTKIANINRHILASNPLSRIRNTIEKILPKYTYFTPQSHKNKRRASIKGIFLDGVKISGLDEVSADTITLVADIKRRYILSQAGMMNEKDGESLVLLYHLDPATLKAITTTFPNLQIVATLARTPKSEEISFSACIHK